MHGRPNWAAQIFLVLFPAAVGCRLGGLLLDPGGETGAFVIACTSVALILAVAGAASPVLVIKKRLRSYRMLSGIGHSALSRQALLVGLFVVLLLAEWALALAGVFALWLAVLVVVVGTAAVLVAGLVYMIGSQPAWRHWSVPLVVFAGLPTLGVSLALLIALGWRESLLGLSAGQIAGLVLVLAGALALGVAAWAHARYLSRAGLPTAETRVLLKGRYRWSSRLGLALVMLAGIAAAASFASSWMIIVAFPAFLGGLFVMRRLFFVAGVPLSWKNEVHWSLPPEVVVGEG
jgi:DMSO reductase anchor subunit